MLTLMAALGMASSYGDSLRAAAGRAVFADLRDGLFVIDADERIVDLNATAERIVGREAATIIGQSAREVLVGPLAAFLTDGGTNGEAVDISMPAMPEPRVYALRSLPLADADGAANGRLLILRDTTAYRRAETLLQATFLADASATLSATLDYDVTLQQAARLAVPALGDWCTVYMLEEDGAVRRVAVAYADGEKAALAAALRRFPPSPVSPNSTVSEVMRTGQPTITARIPDAYVSSISQNAEHLEIMRRLDFRSSMTVPLQARGVVLGAVAVFSSDPERRYDAADLALATDLAQRAALAIDNSRLYREAQRAIRSRDEFLSVAAHELKTPLTSMLGFTQLLLRGLASGRPPNDRLIERALRALESQSERLSKLVTRLLDIARIEAGRLVIEPRSVDLATVVHGVVDSMRISRPGCSFTIQAPDTLLADVDPVRIEQVLTNLLDNAARHSPAGSPVTLTLEQSPSHDVTLTVTDRGDGIPAEHRERIFDRFYQADAGEQITGMGLGLFICREIVEQHGGTITVTCPTEGGTRFTVILPPGTGKWPGVSSA